MAPGWSGGRARRVAPRRLRSRLTNGRWPQATVKTSCGNPACCRPEHLVEATAASPPKKRAVNRVPGVGSCCHDRRTVGDRCGCSTPAFGSCALPVRATVWPSPPAVSRTFHGSRAEAEEALAELREQAEHGGPLRLDPTFGELVSAYLGWYQRESDVGVPAADLVVAAARALAAEALALCWCARRRPC